MKTNPFHKISALLLFFTFVFILLPTSALAYVLGGGNYTFYIGQFGESAEILTSDGIGRPIITQDMPAGTGVAGGDYGMKGKSFKGTALPGKASAYTVKATDEYGADETSYTMTIAPGPQTIVQPNINKKMSDGNFTVIPHSTDGNGNTIDIAAVSPSLVALHQPTYTFSAGTDPTVATINSTTGAVTLLKPGTTTITVSSGATGSYTAATNSGSLTFDIVVDKADPTISASSQTAVLGLAKTVTATLADAYLAGADSIAFAATSGAVSVLATATANGNISFNLSAADINALGVGIHTFTIQTTSTSGNAGVNNNQPTSVQFTLTINAAPHPPSPLPKTGDGFPLYALLTLLGVGLIALVYIGVRLGKQRRGA